MGPQKPTRVEDQPFLWAALLSLDFKKSRDPNDSSTKVFGNVDQKNELSFFLGVPPILKSPYFDRLQILEPVMCESLPPALIKTFKAMRSPGVSG